MAAEPSIKGVEMAQVMSGAADSFFGSQPGAKGGPLHVVGLDLAHVFHEYKHHREKPEAAEFRPRNELLKIADQPTVVDDPCGGGLKARRAAGWNRRPPPARA